MNVSRHFSLKICRSWLAIVAAVVLLGWECAEGAPPAARYLHTAVWTGSDMVVWGGVLSLPLHAGGRYDPLAGTWTTIPTNGAPTPRYYHPAIWTGSNMIVWGGYGYAGPSSYLNTGGRYDPAPNSWSTISTNSAPVARSLHTAVWTGSNMIVWGGLTGSGALNSGGRYHPASDSWSSVSTSGAPFARAYHTAVWTGTEMIVWGGDNAGSKLSDGGRYNPVSNTWANLSFANLTARYLHTAIWTGTEMIIWGGYGTASLNTGGRYNPVGNSWTTVNTNGAATARSGHTAVWTGTEMIVWGGYGSSYLNTGGRYNPVANTWTPMTTAGAPSPRGNHVAVWTGSEMIVWGGYGDTTYLGDGGRYNPTTDTWSPLCESDFSDQFACRKIISGDVVSLAANNVGATKESGEPNHGGNAGGKSVWWSWTAPASGGVTLTTAGSDFDTLLAVYTGTNVSALTTVASDGRTNLAGSVTFKATAGVDYKIAVDGNNGAAGNILLNLNLRARPSNDDFANRISIASGSFVTGNNFGATMETGETNHAGVIGGKSVWWTWTPTSNSCVTITTVGSDFDTVLCVYTNPLLPALRAVAVSDDASSATISAATFKATAGTTYQIAVDGYNRTEGNIVLQVLPFAGPPNDNFTSSTLLSGSNLIVTNSNICASAEAGEPDHGNGLGAPSLWWTWVAPASGGATIDLRGSDFSTALTVYTGSSLGTLTPVASAANYLVFKAVSGTTYRIAVDVGDEFPDPAAAKLKLKLTSAPAPVNDDFANRTSLGFNPGVTTNGSNLGATTESSETSQSIAFVPRPQLSGKTVWWTWATPYNLPARITTRSSNFVSAVTIYTGSTLTGLTRIGGRVGITPTNEVNFSAIPSTSYIIAVDGVDGAEGNFEFSIGNVSAATNDLFANRITLNGTNVSTIGWNKGASRESLEPNHAGVAGVASVWWSWTAPTAGRLFLTTLGSTYSPLLGVYQGTSVSGLTSVANISYPGQQCPNFSSANLNVAALQTYQIAVDGESGSPQPVGGIDLSLAFVPKPANDDFASRTLLTGSSLVVTGSVIAASQQSGEVVAGNASGLRTVWYSWTAPTDIGGTSGSVTLRVSGIDFSSPDGTAIAEVYQGNSVSGLTNVTVLSEQKGSLRQITFQAQAGATYQIVVAGDQFTGGGLDDSFAQRRGNIPPDPLAESGSFVLRLNYSTLALRIRNIVPTSVPFPGQFGYAEKVPFGAEAQVINYGQTSSNPVRVRLLAVTTKGTTLGDESIFASPSGAGVSPGGTASIPICGGSQFGGSVLAVLEEQMGGDWFIRDTGVVIVGFANQGLLCSIVTGGGVVLLEPGLGAGQCFCPPLLTRVQINGPASVAEGSAAAFWGTAVFNNGSTPNFTNTIWTTSNTNKFPITTNGVLTAGSVTADTSISVNTRFSYLGIEQSTNKPVTVLNLPPPSLANLLRLPNGNFQLSLQGVPNRQHVVEATTNLAPPINWTSLTTNSANPSGAFQFTDTKATNFFQRFYRAREY